MGLAEIACMILGTDAEAGGTPAYRASAWQTGCKQLNQQKQHAAQPSKPKTLLA